MSIPIAEVGNVAPLILVVVVIVALVILGIFFYFLKVWVRALAAGASDPAWGMRAMCATCLM